MADHTIQLKKFRKDEDDPYTWFEWRNIDPEVYGLIRELLLKLAGPPMDRAGD